MPNYWTLQSLLSDLSDIIGKLQKEVDRCIKDKQSLCKENKELRGALEDWKFIIDLSGKKEVIYRDR